MNELVSVIVPCYNHAAFLEERLRSIYGQSYRSFEVILLDDSSTDGSRQILERYRNDLRTSHVIFNEQNSGSTFAQWRKGISLAKGKYVWIAESDDSCALNFLDVAVRELNEGSELFYCRNVNINADGTPRSNSQAWYKDLVNSGRWKVGYRNTTHDEMNNYLAFKNILNNASAVVFTREPWQIDTLSELVTMKFCGDWIFWWTCMERWHQVTYSTDTVNYFRFHGTTTRTNTKYIRNPEIHRVLEVIINWVSDERHKKNIMSYFFVNHYGIYPRIHILKNLGLMREQVKIHKFFGKCWLRYYLFL